MSLHVSIGFSPGYFLSRSASDGKLTSLYGTSERETAASAHSDVEHGTVTHLPCRSVITANPQPHAKRLLPKPEEVEVPYGWKVPRYSPHVLCPDKVKRAHLDKHTSPSSLPEDMEKPNGWSVKRHGGPQVARYVNDPYSSFVRPSRAVSERRPQNGDDWMQKTGRRGKEEEDGTATKPDGWSVPRYSPMFTRLADPKSGLGNVACGSHYSGVSPGIKRVPPGSPSKDADKKENDPFAPGCNPFIELKKAAIAAEQRRVARAGDNVDVPAGWTVDRYAKGLSMGANELMKADPRGRPSITSNMWWPLPRGAAATAVDKHGGMDAARTAAQECRRPHAAGPRFTG